MGRKIPELASHAKVWRRLCQTPEQEIGAWPKRFYTTRFWLMPKRPPRLDWIFQSYDPPLFFITFNTYRRRKLLANSIAHDALVTFARVGETRGIGVGRYVIMPDHVHLFARGGPDFVLTQWVRILKRTVSKAISIEPPHWQEGFFDHLVRHSESYAEKWEYVRQNPVRAGLVSIPDQWPWQGEIVRIEA